MADATALSLMSQVVPFNREVEIGFDESELVDLCVKGDATACRILYQRYRLDVFKVVARMLDNPADREDVVQEAFLQIFRSLTNFKAAAKLSTWIHRVTINVVLQHIRAKKSRIKLTLDAKPETLKRTLNDESKDSPERAEQRRERQTAVKRVLQTLSPKKRIVIILSDFEGLDATTIASMVHAPVMTVRTRLFYARRDFYERLAKEPAFSDIGPLRPEVN